MANYCKHNINEVYPMSLNMRDLMLLETAEDDIMTLCDALGFKYQLLSRGSGTTFNNQELAQKAQYQDNIIPMADNYMSQFNDCVYAEENNVKYIIDFSHVPCMQADEKLKSEIRKNNVGSVSLQLKTTLSLMVVQWRYLKKMHRLN